MKAKCMVCQEAYDVERDRGQVIEIDGVGDYVCHRDWPGFTAGMDLQRKVQEAESVMFKEELMAASATIASQETLLTDAAAQREELQDEITHLEARSAATPPGANPPLAALETRIATMEQEVARLLSQPAPPTSMPQTAPETPPKPARKMANEALLDRLDKRLRNGPEPAP